MGENVVASLTASIVIDAKDSAVQAMAAIAEAQKELNKHKLEFTVDISDVEVIKKVQKIINGKDYTIKFKENGIEQITKDVKVLIDAFNKMNSGKGLGIGNSIADEKSLQKAMDLFEKVESHLASLKKVVSDVGDGQEFSPLLSTIKDVESAVTGLSNTFSKLKLNINVDTGSGDPKLLSKIEGQKQNVLTAYRNQFAEMKKIRPSNDDVVKSMFGNNGMSVFAKSLQKEILEFSELDFDSINAKISAYENIIKKMKQLSEERYGVNIYDNIDPSFKNKLASAKGNLTKAQNELKQGSLDGLNDLFGKTDLSEVISGLNTICEKLDSIVTSANEIKNVFSGAIKIEGTTAEITDLTNKVKELEAELNKLKSAGVSGSSTVAQEKQLSTKNAIQQKREVEEYTSKHNFDVRDSQKYYESLTEAVQGYVQALKAAKTAKTEEEQQKQNTIAESYKQRYKTIRADGDAAGTTRDYEKELELSQLLLKTKEEIEIIEARRRGNEAVAQEKQAYLDLVDVIDKYATIQKRIASGKTLTGDMNELQELQERIQSIFYSGENPNNSILSEAHLNALEKRLQDILTTLSDIQKAANPKINERDFDSLRGIYRDLAIQNLTEKGNQVLNDSVTLGLEKGLIKVTAQIKTAQGAWETFTATMDRDGRLFDRKFKPITGNTDKLDAKLENRDIDAYKNVLTEYARIQTEINKLTTRQVQGEDVSKELEKEIAKLNALEDAALHAKLGFQELYNPNNTDPSYIAEWNKNLELIKNSAKGSAESVRSLNKAMQDVKTKVAGKLDNASTLLTKTKATPPEGERKESYITSVNALETAYNNLKAAQDTLLHSNGPISAEQRKNIDQYITELEKAEQALKNLSKSDKGASLISRTKLGNQINEYMHKNSGMSKDFKNQFQALLNEMNFKGAESNVTDLTTRFLNLKVAVRNAGQEGRSFLDVIKDKAWYGLAGQISMYVNLYSAINKVREAITTIVSLDDALVDLKKTTTMSASELNQFYFDSNNVARQMGVTTQEIIEQASAWSRLGYNTKESATEMAKLSSKFASISPGMSTDEAQSGLVSVMKAWDVQVDQVESQIMDKINILGRICPNIQ